MNTDLNIFYKPLQSCKGTSYDTSTDYCKYYVTTSGTFIVCVKLTNEFINYSKKRGCDLTLKNNITEGDYICVCVYKWIDAYHAGIAPKIVGESTPVEMLKYVPMEILKNYII